MPKAGCWALRTDGCWAVRTAYCRAGNLAAGKAAWKAVRSVAPTVEQMDHWKVELKAARRVAH